MFRGHENIVLGLHNPQKVSIKPVTNVTVSKIQVGLEMDV